MTPSKEISSQELIQDHSAYELGLVGYPLGHSLSPVIHKAALETLSLNGTYRLYPIPGDDDDHDVKQLLQKMRMNQVQGLNVTIPHKQSIIKYLDHLTPTAAAIGAVNTVYRDGLNLVGDNTDMQGFWMDINKVHGLFMEEGGKCLVLGAGGSARAVIYALVDAGLYVTIAARNVEQAEQIRNQFSDHKKQIAVVQWNAMSDVIASSILIVNATPLGMHPHSNISPLPVGFPLPREVFVYDLVYNPIETRLVKEAKAQGLKAVGGLGMLVEQAAISFECWTGLSTPRDVMIEAAYGER